ncbi:hypothetical protein [Zavarzinella formosa]|uniref:hypothetical protein n=1 Tax=Zavarzinella formosa TaxID=360055 RepID=UPI00031E6755|nr:hypothetical protein [Zavarzinella formosa]
MRNATIAAVTGLLLLTGSLRADQYTPWVKDEKTKTYSCEYKYVTRANKPAVQNVVVYYGDNDRKNWAYFYNEQQKPWARCAVPGNPKYDQKAMYWQHIDATETKYQDYEDKDYCPAPKDGKNAIPSLPLPPK